MVQEVPIDPEGFQQPNNDLSWNDRLLLAWLIQTQPCSSLGVDLQGFGENCRITRMLKNFINELRVAR